MEEHRIVSHVKKKGVLIGLTEEVNVLNMKGPSIGGHANKKGVLKLLREEVIVLNMEGSSIARHAKKKVVLNRLEEDITNVLNMEGPIIIGHAKKKVRNTPPLSDVISDAGRSGTMGPKLWTQEDMELALDALRNNMSLTKASATYHIPSPTLWKRARRMGVDIPKLKIKSWTEDNLNSALEAIRSGAMSANKASKAYGIPSSTLFKNAHLKGIRLTTPFNAAPTTWTQDDLEQALVAISSGQTSVQHASTEYGIPRGTLYGRCKRDGIKLCRSNVALWSEESMAEALEAVRVGQMSIKDASSHYKLPYSSLYGRLKRTKYQVELAPSSG
uniref:HTH psq-type domain-containing protein n=1 Tax=Timema genevievae TaxID=629358 RepID=A0A7R9PJN2_TIMGE|nr:unnamed protein product [Timema genevievae]